LETDFAQMSIGPPKGDSRPASAQRLQRDGAGGVNGSISLSSSPRAARQRPIWSHGTAPLTPRLGAPRPPSREHTPAHRSGGAATTPQCRPARVRPLKHLLLRPSNRRADLQPLRALPPRATSSALQTVPPASPPHTGLPCPWISFFCHCQGSDGKWTSVRNPPLASRGLTAVSASSLCGGRLSPRRRWLAGGGRACCAASLPAPRARAGALPSPLSPSVLRGGGGLLRRGWVADGGRLLRCV